MGIGDVSLPLCDAVIEKLHEAVDDQSNAKDQTEKPKQTAKIIILGKRHTERQNNGSNGVNSLKNMMLFDFFTEIRHQFLAFAFGKIVNGRTGNISDFLRKTEINGLFFTADAVKCVQRNGKKDQISGEQQQVSVFLVRIDELAVFFGKEKDGKIRQSGADGEKHE